MAEEATVDCYNEYETYAGWACMLEDELSLPLKCRIFDEQALLVGIETDDNDTAVLGIIKMGKKKIRVPIQDIELMDKKLKSLQWLDAYRHWLRII